MGHLLASVNPQAAAEADSGPKSDPVPNWTPGELAGMDLDRPPIVTNSETPMTCADVSRETLPAIGQMVVYHLREGDSRNRRVKFPAVVMDADQESGTLKLWVIVDDGDTWMQDHVPALKSPEAGWEPVAQNDMVAALAHSVASLTERVVDIGQHMQSLMVRLDEAERKIELLQRSVSSVGTIEKAKAAPVEPKKRGAK